MIGRSGIVRRDTLDTGEHVGDPVLVVRAVVLPHVVRAGAQAGAQARDAAVSVDQKDAVYHRHAAGQGDGDDGCAVPLEMRIGKPIVEYSKKTKS